MTLNTERDANKRPLRIGFLIFPAVQLLDVAGPLEVFASIPRSVIDLFWKEFAPVTSSVGASFTPTRSLETIEDLDVFCVPGGPGIDALLDDPAVLTFVKLQASRSRYVTSVCTGALLLGAAGLLQNRQATTHWLMMDTLVRFGARPVRSRVVRDGNVITAAGVTAGIDFGLALTGKLLTNVDAETIQLCLEYSPEPPYSAGNEVSARAEVVARVRHDCAALLERRRLIIERLTADPVRHS